MNKTEIKINTGKFQKGRVPWNKGMRSDNSMWNKDYCKCGNIKTRKSSLCWECYNESHKGENCYQYKGIKKNCIDCDKEITFYATRCFSCDRKFRVGRNANNYKGVNTKQICKNCGEVFERYRVGFCSKECFSEYNKGENNPRYKGNNATTKIRRLIMSMKEYTEWRNFIFQRDGYTCKDCGETNKYLQAHHIKSMAMIIKENKLKTIIEARNCEELWDSRNGITLCRECHSKTDTYLKQH